MKQRIIFAEEAARLSFGGWVTVPDGLSEPEH
jgi:hypothetical protein